ncbi:MAG: hypothetical protein KatS3mg011_1239 [Acidimicrobiia bacterium]|nr:MAG: hypothetical protein KatS3mg011_1239 [Acidimicrobiia bacterium]
MTPTVDDRSSTRVVLGWSLVGAGLLWLGHALGLFDVRFGVVVSIALVVVGLAIAWTGFRGRLDGSLVAVAVVLGLLSLGLVQVHTVVTSVTGVSDRTLAPESETDLEPAYELGVGDLTLDLSRVSLSGNRTTRLEVGIGSVTVRVPPQATTRVLARVGVGRAAVGNTVREGAGLEVRETLGDGDPTLTLEIDVGIGSVEVVP